MASQLLIKVERELNNMSGEILEESDKESFLIKRKVLSPVKAQMPYLIITGVSVVHNNYLHLMYQLKKEEYRVRYGTACERRLYHATSAYNVNSIITENLDWRRVSRNKFGKGVSFSDDSDYANFHCNRSSGDSRALIVADVLVNRVCAGGSYMTVPTSGTDTATGNNHVYVKFNDHEFLPRFVIFYKSPDRTKSKHFSIRHRRFFF